jgi:hypothetical protein
VKTGYSGNRTQQFYVRKSSWDWVLVGQPCAACLAAVYAEVGDAPDAVCLDPLLDLCMLQGRLAVQWNKSTAKKAQPHNYTLRRGAVIGLCVQMLLAATSQKCPAAEVAEGCCCHWGSPYYHRCMVQTAIWITQAADEALENAQFTEVK